MSYKSKKELAKRHSNTDDNFDFDEDYDLNEDGLNSVLSFEESSPGENKRTSRNQNEKNRRDQFNGLIQEIGILVNTSRKTDKASVLNEAINYFHNNNSNKIYGFYIY